MDASRSSWEDRFKRGNAMGRDTPASIISIGLGPGCGTPDLASWLMLPGIQEIIMEILGPLTPR